MCCKHSACSDLQDKIKRSFLWLLVKYLFIKYKVYAGISIGVMVLTRPSSSVVCWRGASQSRCCSGWRLSRCCPCSRIRSQFLAHTRCWTNSEGVPSFHSRLRLPVSPSSFENCLTCAKGVGPFNVTLHIIQFSSCKAQFGPTRLCKTACNKNNINLVTKHFKLDFIIHTNFVSLFSFNYLIRSFW